MNTLHAIPIKNCWLCGSGVILRKNNNISIIQCNKCLERGVTIKCENENEQLCIKTWNESRILLSDDDIMNITRSISKDPSIDINLVKKLNTINTYNTHYTKNCNEAKRFGYGAIIDPQGKINFCTRPHVDVMLKYFNIDYNTLTLENIDAIYEKLLSSDTFVDNFLKIVLYMTVLICHIPKNCNESQITTLITYLSDLKKCYTSINRIEIKTNITLMTFNTFDDAIEYLLRF